MVVGIFVVLLFYAIGEGVSLAINGVIPGSVIGMLLLFVALQLRVIPSGSVKGFASFLTSNMALFFVPAGVGLMVAYRVLLQNWVAITVVSVVSTVIVMAVVGHTHQQFEKKQQQNNQLPNESEEDSSALADSSNPL